MFVGEISICQLAKGMLVKDIGWSDICWPNVSRPNCFRPKDVKVVKTNCFVFEKARAEMKKNEGFFSTSVAALAKLFGPSIFGLWPVLSKFYDHKFTIVNYASVCSLAYDHNLRS
jgi:hypothetical protein